jgi:hypothetical protein
MYLMKMDIRKELTLLKVFDNDPSLADGGNIKLVSLKVNKLESVWK